jgi:glycosyltransferase involved in cell wall biosynthesis
LAPDIERAYLYSENIFHRWVQKVRLGPLHVQGRRLFRLRLMALQRAKQLLKAQVDAVKPEAVIVFDTLMAKLAAESSLHGHKVIVQYHNSFQALSGKQDMERMRKVSKRVSAFLALTKVDAELFAEAGFARCFFIPNPVSFYPRNLPAERARRIIALGRYHYQKAFDHLVSAWAEVKNKDDWHLDIFGEGSEREKIQAAIEMLGVGASVTIHAPTQRVEEILSEASIFALSSRYEGLCMVALEALACGVPIVSTRSGPGTEELVTGCGLLSAVGDVPNFARNLERMIEDGELRSRFSTAGRVKALEYGPARIAARWRELIARVDPIPAP